MPVTTGGSPREGSREAALRHDETRRNQLALLAELREVEHWRRLLAARLDLAVAAVAAVDEPVVRALPAAPAPPFGLRELVGLDGPGHGGREVLLLLRLREAQRDLDAYACALRASTRAATAGLASRLDDRRPPPDAGDVGQDAFQDTHEDVLAPVLPLRRRGRAGHRREGPDDVA
jgi:hypothetical protein